MLKHYLRVAVRHLRRERGYAVINVAGLAAGIACCLLIALWVQDERAFDRFHADADRIVRLAEVRLSPDGEEQRYAYTAGPLAPTLAETMPEVTGSVRLISRWASGRMTIERGEHRFYSGDHLFAEPGFFDVFDFDLRRGDPATALSEPGTVVLTETTAAQLFGEADPMGQTIGIERYGDAVVTGVLADPPPNSHLDFSMLLSFASLQAIDGWRVWLDEDWSSDGVMTYLRLRDPADIAAVEARAAALVEQHRDPEDGPRTAYVQPLGDVHFGSGAIEFEENHAESDVAYVYVFSAIALFVLLIACINYMNLATARATGRAREVGVRKAVGAQRGQLVGQMMSEAVVTVALAVAVGVGAAALALPFFNDLAGKALGLTASPGLLLGLVGLTLVVGFVAGSYPALFLAGLRPVRALREHENALGGAAGLRRGLVVTQFALAIVLVALTLVASRQLDFLQTTSLGFNDDRLVVVDINSGDVRRDFAAVKAAFEAVPGVERVSVTSRVPGDWKNITQVDAAPAGTGAPATTVHFLGVDEDFLDTYEMTLVAGRGFAADRPADSSAVLVNETAARAFGWADPLGRIVEVPESAFEGRVIGVVEDFHFRSLHEPIGPLVLGYRTNPIRAIDYFTARITGGDVPATLAGLRAVGERFDPSHPFEYNFLDERLADFYTAEARVRRVFEVAAGLAVLIAALGLFGLAAFMIGRRRKEIGVRKVLGASTGSIVLLLTRRFAVLVLVSAALALPLAYLAAERWLDGFTYHIDLGPGVFVAAGLVALAVALATVSGQAFRAASTNPVNALRTE